MFVYTHLTEEKLYYWIKSISKAKLLLILKQQKFSSCNIVVDIIFQNVKDQ